MKFLYLTALIALTIVSWGVYGPVLHEGQLLMGGPPQPSVLLSFICVGIAYFLITVIVSVVLLWIHGDQGHWSAGGVFWSFMAGAFSAVAALGIILAFHSLGKPVYVMVLVFALAPVVHTFISLWMSKSLKQAGSIFYAGAIVVAVGAVGVMFFKPIAQNVTIQEHSDGSITVVRTEIPEAQGQVKEKQTNEWNATNLKELRKNFEAYRLYIKNKSLTIAQFVMVILYILLAAFCWGCYGPVLHKGQMKMDGSRLRPLFCIGMAYLAIAVVVPYLVLASQQEPEQWTFWGSAWSLAAGTVSVVGSLGILLAFHFGGRPTVVMSLVFGGAPVVNTFSSLLWEGSTSQVSSTFLTAMVLLIAGSVVVLVFSPKQAKTLDSEEEKSLETSAPVSENSASQEASGTTASDS